MKKLLILLMAMTVLSGCGSSEKKEVVQEEKEYVFEASGVTIQMNKEAAPLIQKLGKEISYFEAKSCAFEGLDKTYTYPGFQLVTYPKDDKDYVSSIELKDDSVSTPEGVSIGDPVSKIEEVYGKDHQKEDNAYSYTSGKSTLKFIFEDDSITSITYTAITK